MTPKGSEREHEVFYILIGRRTGITYGVFQSKRSAKLYRRHNLGSSSRFYGILRVEDPLFDVDINVGWQA